MAAPKKKTSAPSEKPEPKTGPLTNLSDDHTSILIEKYSVTASLSPAEMLLLILVVCFSIKGPTATFERSTHFLDKYVAEHIIKIWF